MQGNIWHPRSQFSHVSYGAVIVDFTLISPQIDSVQTELILVPCFSSSWSLQWSGRITLQRERAHAHLCQVSLHLATTSWRRTGIHNCTEVHEVSNLDWGLKRSEKDVFTLEHLSGVFNSDRPKCPWMQLDRLTTNHSNATAICSKSCWHDGKHMFLIHKRCAAPVLLLESV